MAEENKKFDVSFENNELNLGIDLNKDGEKLMKVKLNLGEAIQEAFKKGEAIEGAKVVAFEFKLTKLVVKIDTDRDGESLLEIEIDLAEALDEVGVLKS